jgi:hypothetical protein
MPEHLSQQEVSMKQRMISSILGALGKGIELDPTLKITEVYGHRDLTTMASTLTQDSNKKDKGLGKHLLPRGRDGSRRVGVDMQHLQPFDRPNELERLKRIGVALS